MEAILSVVLSILQIVLAVASILVLLYLFFGGAVAWVWSVVTGALTAVRRMLKRLCVIKGNHVRIEIPRVSVKVADKQQD